jgi:hypothetical protein
MTPKEKAKELIEKYKNQLDTATPILNRPFYQARECALIAVDEIILDNEKQNDFVGMTYWQEVKDELQYPTQ